jgi:hypothetical protein
VDRYFVGSQNRLQPRCIKPLPGCIVKELSYLTYLLHITFPNTQVFLNSFSSLEREKSKSLMTRRSSGFVEGVLQLPSTASTFGDLINRTSSIRQACVRVVHGSGGRSLPSSPQGSSPLTPDVTRAFENWESDSRSDARAMWLRPSKRSRQRFEKTAALASGASTLTRTACAWATGAS